MPLPQPSASRGENGPQRLGPAPKPLVLTTTSRRPLGVTLTSAGYQAVGISPRSVRVARSTTAIAFSPASATYSVAPSGLTVRPSGIEPLGEPGTGATSMVAASRSLRPSITDTVSLLALATYSSRERGLATIA